MDNLNFAKTSMRIKYFLITAVLATAIFGSAGFVKAAGAPYLTVYFQSPTIPGSSATLSVNGGNPTLINNTTTILNIGDTFNVNATPVSGYTVNLTGCSLASPGALVAQNYTCNIVYTAIQPAPTLTVYFQSPTIPGSSATLSVNGATPRLVVNPTTTLNVGDTFDVTATPVSGYTVNLTGCSSSGVIVAQNYYCNIVYTANQTSTLSVYFLNPSVSGSFYLPGSSAVLSINGGTPTLINNATTNLSVGSTFAVTATPVAGYTVNLTGCSLGGSGTVANQNYICNITYNPNSTLTVYFQSPTIPGSSAVLSINGATPRLVVNPTTPLNPGDTFTVTATPVAGYTINLTGCSSSGVIAAQNYYCNIVYTATSNTIPPIQPTDNTNQALIAQLQAQIQSLMQQIQQLIAQQQGGQTWCHTFNSNLGYANTGAEVSALQTALTKNGFDVSGDTSGTYDDATASAVSGFQEKYASTVLTPKYLTHGTGYVGSSTRVKLNALYGCR